MWYRLFSVSSSARIVLTFSIAVTAVAVRGNNPDAKDEANQLVAKALDAEANGELVQRDLLLSEASALSAKLPSANWYRGKVLNSKGAWESVDQSIEDAQDHALLETYEELRNSKGTDVKGHWEMARWCAQKKLAEQCRAHLFSIINIDPDHSGARSALGFRLVGTEWVGPDKLNELATQAQTASESQAKYGLKIKQLITSILGNNVAVRTQARSALEAITDPLAIPAMESAANQSQATAEVVVNWLGKIDVPESSQSLARFALNYPSSEINQLSIEHLKGRQYYDYIPQLIESMTGPIQASLVPSLDRRGNLVGFRQAFAKEGMNENRVLLVERTLTERGRRSEFRRRDPLNTMVQQMAQSQLVADANTRGLDVELENQEIALRNRKVVSLISELTDREFPNAPQDVWKWWDEHNQSNYQAFKPARYRRDALNFEVPEYSTPGFSGECFVAGTLITTQRGLRPIEKVAVGDMALSRNAKTGELCWKPVVVCTTRPPEPTVMLQVDEDKLRCTLGHLLWVSGKGWTKASEVKGGDILHTASEPAVVSEASKAESAQTYNLEVADNHTYFAGKCRILSHDVTPRGSSRDLVPGQTSLARSNPSVR